MSLGSRTFNRGRAALTANLAPTPREPLLFLYPQWTSKSSMCIKAAIGHDTTGKVQPAQRQTRRNPLSTNAASATNYQISSNPDEITTTNLTVVFPERPLGSQDPSIVERKVRKVTSVAKGLANTETANRRVRKAYQEFRREQLKSWHPDWRIILADLKNSTPQQGKWIDNALEIVLPLESLTQLLHGIDDFILEIGQRYGCSIDLGNRDEDVHQYRRFIISGPPNAISKTTADILRIAPDTEIELLPTAMTSKTLALENNSLEQNSISTSGSIEKGTIIRNVMASPGTEKLSMPPGKIPRPKEWDPDSFLDYIRTLTTSTMPNHLDRFGFGMAQNHRAAVTEIVRSLFQDPACRHSISRTACHEAMKYFVKISQLHDARRIFDHLDMLDLQMVPETFNILLRGAAKSEDLHNFHFILHLLLRRGLAPNGETWLAFMSAHPDIRVKVHILTAMKEKGLASHPSILKGVCQQLVGLEIDSAIEQSLGQDEFLANMDSRYGDYWLSLDTANRILDVLGARGLISRCSEFLSLMETRFIRADNCSVNTVLHHCKQATNLNGAVELLQNLPSNTRFLPDQETYRILFELAWHTRSYNLARVVWRYACLSAATTFRMRRRVSQSLLYARAKDARMNPRERWNQYAGPVIFGGNSKGEHPVQLMANIEFVAESGSAIDETDGEDFRSSECLSEVAATKVRDVAKASLDDARPHENELRTSEIHPSEAENINGQIEGNKNVGIRATSGQIISNNLQSQESNDSERSIIRKVLWENFWEHVEPEVRQKIGYDLEIYKGWWPVKPFSKMLVEALERDINWRKVNYHAEKDMHSLIRDAIPVLIRSKIGKKHGGIGEHKWK